jgi:predicted ATPase
MATPELDYITIQGFKSIASVERLALRPINIIIGPNGSGKSNFIGVFAFLHEVHERRLNDYVRRSGGAEQVLYFGAKTTQEIKVIIYFHNEGYPYELGFKPTENDGLFLSHESILSRDPKVFNAVINGHLPPDFECPLEYQRLASWRVYHVHDTSASSPLRKTAKLHDNAFLRPDGSNLPAFLYLLQKKHPDTYGLIRRTVQRVAPFFDDFLLNPDPLNEETIRLAWRHKNSDQYFGASSLSDGTLRFVALATLFLQPEKFLPSVILVDEPELGLHPSAITLLASLVKQASVKTQVILSTQSPQLLDHFEPEDVLVAERVKGGTQLTRLESSRLAAWLEDYSLGQLWEKNEIGGRPAAE